MNTDTKRKCKVGKSARAIMIRLYPPIGLRPETEAYRERCFKLGLRYGG